MGRHTSFYKLNKQAAKDILYEDLISDTKFKKSFSTYIDERRTEEKDYEISAGKIFQTVLIDFNQISLDELFEIEAWYYDVLHTEPNSSLNEYLEKVGIILMFNISTTAWCNSFMFQFGNFTHAFELKSHYGSNGGNIETSYFICFLDYMILLTNKIKKDEIIDDYFADYSLDEEEAIELIKRSWKDDKRMQNTINKEFSVIKTGWLEYKENGEENWRNPEANTIFANGYFFDGCLRMKKSLLADPEATNVIIDDSY